MRSTCEIRYISHNNKTVARTEQAVSNGDDMILWKPLADYAGTNAEQKQQKLCRLHVNRVYVITLKIWDTRNKCKKLRFRHELTANDTSTTTKNTKRWLPTSTSPKYHLFVIFAVLDVSFAVNSCLNCSFFNIYICRPWYPQFLRYSCSPASPYQVRYTKVVIVTYFPNPSFVPNMKLLASTVAERSRGS